jgi:hypothetical protein
LAPISVPVKTPQAVAELTARARTLSQRHRTVLLLVDGLRNEEQVRFMALQAGCPGGCFDELVASHMIAYAEPAVAATTAASHAAPAIPNLKSTPTADSILSLLPASLSLQPSLNDSILNEPASTNMGELEESPSGGHQDPTFEEARIILIRAVRTEAPVAGALTLLRLRRANSRQELEALLDEVELRITKPFKGLWATQTILRVKELLLNYPAL